MSENQPHLPDVPAHAFHGTTRERLSRHRFFIMIISSVLIAIGMAAIGLALYASSGAAQLDLSRPGYSEVRSQTNDDREFTGFSSNGPINEASLSEFRILYEEQLKAATDVEAYGSDVMTNEALRID